MGNTMSGENFYETICQIRIPSVMQKYRVNVTGIRKRNIKKI